jgi:hypothetical protein
VRVRLWINRLDVFSGTVVLLEWLDRIQSWIYRVMMALMVGLLPFIAFVTLMVFRNPEPSTTETFF